MSVTAIHHTLVAAAEGEGLSRKLTAVGQWDVTARSGENLRIVAVNTTTAPAPGVVSDVLEFDRKVLADAVLSGC